MKSLLLSAFVIQCAVVALLSPPPVATNNCNELDDVREKFVVAFNSGEISDLKEGIAPTADLILPDGSIYRGEAEIIALFEDLIGSGTQIEMNPDSQRYITSDVAIEDGTFTFSPVPTGMPEVARYTVVLVKDNDRWVVASIRDSVPTSSE